MKVSFCLYCGGQIVWIECPTGGWWKHDNHPLDDHDAEPETEELDEDFSS